ncbi:MAG TPA: hypothetical protein DCW60_01405 [Sutterella sp.]|nr:hypothetical protein [Sutterella sp.]
MVEKASHRHLSVRALCLAASVCLIALPACREKPRVAPQALNVSTVVATSVDTPRYIDTFGETSGLRQVDVYAQVSGILKTFSFAEGATVRAGDILFEIEKEPYEAALNEARATVAQAKATLKKATNDFERAKKLVRVEAISRSDYDASVAALMQARATLAAAQAKEKTAQNQLNHAVIRAPVDGTTGKSEVNPGGLVTAYSTLLTTVTQPGALRVDFSVSDTDFAKATFRKDSSVTVFFDNGKKSVSGHLDYISSKVDSATATVKLRASLDPAKGLWPGQYVAVRVEAELLKNVFRVPQKAVKQKPDGTYAIYVAKDGKAREKIVTLSHWEGADWIVTSGLAAGEAVIVDQMLAISDGAVVNVQDAK